MNKLSVLAVVLSLLSGAIGHGHSLPYTKCPPGWISLSESVGCVLFHTEACGGYHGPGCSWIQAMEECQKLGSWLLEIYSLDQQDFVTKMAKALEVVNGPMDWWVGLTDLGHEGTWLWQHSGNQSAVSAWAIGEPNGTYTENCVTMAYGSFNYRWSDVGCGTRERTFPICQSN